MKLKLPAIQFAAKVIGHRAIRFQQRAQSGKISRTAPQTRWTYNSTEQRIFRAGALLGHLGGVNSTKAA